MIFLRQGKTESIHCQEEGVVLNSASDSGTRSQFPHLPSRGRDLKTFKVVTRSDFV